MGFSCVTEYVRELMQREFHPTARPVYRTERWGRGWNGVDEPACVTAASQTYAPRSSKRYGWYDTAWRWLQRRSSPRVAICRHREWTKFGTYSEQMLCRLLDDLC